MPSHHVSNIYLTIIGLSSLLLATVAVSVPSFSSIIPSPGEGSPNPVPVPNPQNGPSRNLEQNFKDFSHNLLLHSDLDEFSVEKGAAISSPWGVGYMLANINEKVWNVSNEGVGSVLQSSRVAEDYQALIERMQKSQMALSSTLFTTDQNMSSSKVPEGSRKMKTETKIVNFIDDWKTTWSSMNGRISNQTGGILDDQLIPKGGWWGGAFYYFTAGAFINTNHYKNSWDASWVDIGPKKFYDGFTVPYIETEGTFPFIENENYTVVAIKLKDGKKTVVFALPKIPIVPFLKTEMPKLVQTGSPKSWGSLEMKKIQIPTLNITLLDQHFKKLEALGVNYTFCVDETDSADVAMKKGSYFSGPIVQSHHVQLSSKFFEVASATGSSLNSEEKMRDEGIYNGPSGPSDNSEEQEEIVPGGVERSEFVLPMDMDPKLIKALAQGEIQLKQVDLLVNTEDGKNDTLSASASSVEQVSVLPLQNQTFVVEVPKIGDLNSTVVEVNVNTTGFVGGTTEARSDAFGAVPDFEKLEQDATSTTTPEAPTTPFVPEPLPEGTIRFDKPFFWYLYDEEMGPLYYGTVHSLVTYQKEYGIETQDDLWLFDAYKTLLWNCP